MGTNWGVVWGAAGTLLSAATLAVVVRQEIRAFLDRPVCDWTADYKYPVQPGPDSDSVIARLDIVLNGDSEARGLQVEGVGCTVLNHRKEEAIVVLGPSQSTHVEVEVQRDKSEQAYLLLSYRTPPHRRGHQELAWLPLTRDSPLVKRLGEFGHLPLLRRLRWRWEHRHVPATGPGGPTPRRMPRSARRVVAKRARASQSG